MPMSHVQFSKIVENLLVPPTTLSPCADRENASWRPYLKFSKMSHAPFERLPASGLPRPHHRAVMGLDEQPGADLVARRGH